MNDCNQHGNQHDNQHGNQHDNQHDNQHGNQHGNQHDGQHGNQQFSFERLDGYRLAREALIVGIEHRDRFRKLPGEIGSQIERALVSVVANIAEGAGRESLADQRRHYVIARGSANEAGALVEIAAVYRAMSEADHARMRERLIRVIRILNAMVRR